ncbi:MAG: CRISPR system precrRNA processing endoribonuclease RAMP protein Cas6 [Oscillospiraceae bacterium]|nr:CRISPR system precrRNA processing endoribonuclease RAMP protein Cas6 [Oscillospiraceae bacterium]
MKHYRFVLSGDEPRIPASCAYALYAWLLSQMPEEVGDTLHQQGETPLSQYLYYDFDRKETIWILSFLADWLAEIAQPVLSGLSCISLHSGALRVSLISCRETPSAPTLIEQARQAAECRYTTFQLLSPVSFRQNGRYVLFPQERLLLQSLIAKWNLTFPRYTLEDADAFQALETGSHIVDYRLRTSRLHIKHPKFPGCYGIVPVESRLSAPLEEIWRLLVRFAPYCGIGIKTTLGMGGVSLLSKQNVANRVAGAVMNETV